MTRPLLSQSERTVFIERKVTETINTLSNPDVNKALNGYAPSLIQDLESAEIAVVEDGIVRAPNNATSLAIIALRRGEEVRMDGHYFTQTEMQATVTMRQMRQWEPQYDIDAIYERVVPNRHTALINRPAVVLARQSFAMVGTSAAILSDRLGKSDYFAAAPDGILLFRHQPTLILGVDGNEPTSASIVHELAHVAKANHDPIITAKSQHTLNMFSLGDELEASGAGAPVAMLEIIKSGKTSAEDIIKHPDFLQIALDDLRHQYIEQYGLINPNKPFQPSGMLLKMVKEQGLDSALHETLNFETIEKIANGA